MRVRTMTISAKTRLCIASITLWLVGMVPVLTQTRQRPPRVDDIFEIERVESFVFAPDGRALAFTHQRPMSTLPPPAQSSLALDIRKDVWLQEIPGQPARNLTNGVSDHTSWWSPRWSPDGQRLAFLSTRGGSITLWVWERSRNQLRQMSAQHVSFSEMEGTDGFVWLDSQRVLCLAPAEGELSRPESGEGYAVRLATEAWAKASTGRSTASPVDSLEFKYPIRRLILLDANTGAGRVLAETSETTRTLEEPHSSTWWPAPDGRAVAFAQPGPVRYNSASRQRMGNPRTIGLRFINKETLRLDNALPENVHVQTLRWSPDGKELAFFANGRAPVNPLLLYGAAAADVIPEEVGALGNPAKLYRVNLAQGHVAQLETGEMDLGVMGSPSFQWTASGELLFYVARRQHGFTTAPPASRGAPWGWTTANAVPIAPSAPREWMVLDRRGQTRPLVAGATRLPRELQSLNGGAGFLGVADGDLWYIDPAKGNLRNLTAGFAPQALSIDIPASRFGAVTRVVLHVSPGDTVTVNTISPASLDSVYVVDLQSGAIASLKKSASQAAGLLAVGPDGSDMIYSSPGPLGGSITRTSSNGQVDRLMEINAFHREIARSKCQLIDYTSLGGTPLKALLCLPFDYQEGQRYPMVVGVRTGSRVRDGDRGLDPERVPALAGDIYNAAGYVYLWPSVPPREVSHKNREQGDSIVMVTNAVLPAVEKAIALGVADPARLFVTGSSRGGWTTLALIGFTNRFKAAASVAYGYGGFSGTPGHENVARRYTTNPMDYSISDGWRKGYRPSDIPWWRDGDAYKRNDPLTYVDHVQTPVLLVHGDLDHDRFALSEQYFHALVTMRKPAQFVRYWGEGHGNRSPANVRDQWRRTLAWFDLWGDISRDAEGKMIFDNGLVKSRKGRPALSPEDFARFWPTASTAEPSHASR